MPKRKTGARIDDDARSQKSHYTNVSKIGSVPSKNLELSLEVELDEEVRRIIRHPEKCPSALLDVTVIKPRGLDQYTTNTQTLKSDQVKKLIGSMRLENDDKKALMQKLFGETKGQKKKVPKEQKEGRKKSCLVSKSKRFYKSSLMSLNNQRDVQCLVDESNTAVFSMYKHERPKVPQANPSLSKIQHIFTTPQTYENIRTMFACQNSEQEHQIPKMEQPCLCQNCAIVGILTDSQKKPFATEPMPNPLEEREPRLRRLSRKKLVGFKNIDLEASDIKTHEQCETIFKLLSVRISELEKRVLMQEQRAVPKDYFKKIITKLVNHLSKLTHYTTEERPLSSSQRDTEYLAPHTKQKGSEKYKYHINPVLTQTSYKVPAEKEYEPKACSSSEPPRGPSETLWKWGEEVLTSGRDLKNRVVLLLEDTLKNLKKSWEKSQDHDKRCAEDDIQSIVDELQKNLKKSVNRERERVDKPFNGGPNAKISEMGKKLARPSLIPRYKKMTENELSKNNNSYIFNRKIEAPAVNVAYINPQLTKWPAESSVSFKIDSSDYDSHKETMTDSRNNQYKNEFYKVLQNTKTTDKYKLWQNIWNQALENRQKKTDTVTIQIPDPHDPLHHKMIHLVCTIGELEELLLKGQK